MQNTKEYLELLNLIKSENHKIFDICYDLKSFKNNKKYLNDNIKKFENNINMIILELEAKLKQEQIQLYELNTKFNSKINNNKISFYLFKLFLLRKIKKHSQNIEKINKDLKYFKFNLEKDIEKLNLEIKEKLEKILGKTTYD